MTDQKQKTDQRQKSYRPSASTIAGAALAGHEELLGAIGKPMLKKASRGVRIVAKTAIKAPRVAFDLVELGTAPNKTRALFGLAGGTVGGVGGTLLGLATGPAAPVNGPIGGFLGGQFGNDIGTDIYDRHRNVIDPIVDKGVKGVRRFADTADQAYEILVNRVRRGAGDIETWMRDRTKIGR